MLIGRVVDDEIHDDFDAAFVCVLHKLDKITARAVTRIDAVKVGDVVAVVAVRRRLERRKPNGADTQRLKIFQTAGEPLKVPDAVAVGVHKCFQVEAINNSVLVP